jgi:hypothetical protein
VQEIRGISLVFREMWDTTNPKSLTQQVHPLKQEEPHQPAPASVLLHPQPHDAQAYD